MPVAKPMALPWLGFSHLWPGSALLPLTRAWGTCCSLWLGHLGSQTRTLGFLLSLTGSNSCQQFQHISTANKRETWNWEGFRLLPQMVIYFPLLCGLTGMLSVSFHSQQMWTFITWYLSLNSRQALTSPFVISRLTKQKKQLMCIEKLHLLWFQKNNIFIWSLWGRSFAASGVLGHLPFESQWKQVTPGVSLLLCFWAFCLLSKFHQRQKLRNGNLCLLE